MSIYNDTDRKEVAARPCVYILAIPNVNNKIRYAVGFTDMLAKRLKDHKMSPNGVKPKNQLRRIQSYNNYTLAWVLYVRDMQAAELICKTIDGMASNNKRSLIDGVVNCVTHSWIEAHKKQNPTKTDANASCIS